MGKTSYNPLGKWTGRVGGQVFKVVNGQQIVQPYEKRTQTNQTDAQLEAQAKMALAGKLSKVTPSEVLRGLSGGASKRRSNFMSNIIKACEVASTEQGQYVATLDYDKLRLSDGRVAFATVDCGLANSKITGSISEADANINSVLLVAVCADADDEYVAVEYLAVPLSGASTAVDFSLSSRPAKVQLYAVPMILNETGKKMIGTGEFVVDATEGAYTLDVVTGNMTRALDWGQSQYITELTDGSAPANPNQGSSSSSGSNGSSGNGENQGSQTTNTVAAPTITGNTSFTESTEVTITGPAESEIHYTTDGSTPTAESALYSEALTLTDTTTVKAIAIKNGVSSSVATQIFTKGSGNSGDNGDTN